MCMNRIMLIIEYMNAIYALEKLDNHFYPATSSFCIRILSSNICILYDIRLLVPWLCGRVIQMCFALYSGSRLKGLIMQARIQDYMLEDTLHRRTFSILLILICFLFF